jgi:cell division protein FtsW (lipid II flippase)
MAQAIDPQVRSRRQTQLALLVLAVFLSVGAYVMVVLGTTGKTPANVAGFVVVLAAAYLGAHLVVQRVAPGADPTFLPVAAMLAGIGYAMIYRLTPGLAAEQFTWMLIGIAFFCLTLIVIRDDRSLEAYTYTIGLVGVGLLLLPIVPGLGATINGERLWVFVGPISFQPSEASKVLLTIFLASYLDRRKELLAVATRRIGPIRLPEPRYFGPLLLAWLVALAVLFVEHDLGSSLLFFGIFVVMLWVATGRGTYLAAGILLFAVAALIGYALIPHVQDRVTIWLHALQPQYIHDEGTQLAQGQFGMATGGMFGSGLGRGFPYYIPVASTDSIFAALGEELGLFGSTAILLLYVALCARGLRTALQRTDGFGKLLAVGLTTVIALQTFVIVGGVIRVIPLTGITLPFVSYGGSSLITNFVLLAMLVRVSAPLRLPAHSAAAVGGAAP